MRESSMTKTASGSSTYPRLVITSRLKRVKETTGAPRLSAPNKQKSSPTDNSAGKPSALATPAMKANLNHALPLTAARRQHFKKPIILKGKKHATLRN